MGHLLKTVNPEAAEQIEEHRPPAGTPGIGEMVVFRPRAGQRRRGRTEFPALVLQAHLDGSLDLIVIMDMNDFWSVEHCKRATDAEPLNAWVLRDSVREVEAFEPSRLNGMTRDLAKLKEDVLGDFLDPPKPIMEILDDFSRRLTKLERALGPKSTKGKK